MGKGNRNSLSVVGRVVVNEHGVALVPGDLDEAGYRAIAADRRDHQADWLVVPHHGGDGGGDSANRRLIELLLDRTGATQAFISYGRRGAYRLPREEVVKALAGRADIRCSQLSTKCMPDPALPTASNAFQHANSAGRRSARGPSCAGTVEIDLDRTTQWTLGWAHDEFVDGAETPLCRRGGRASGRPPGQ